jgi:chorismate dehydratase
MVRLGAVGYLNARPLVYGLEAHVQFELRYDIPSECARLLHAHETDLGLIPSIEYLRGPVPYQIVPGPAVTSRGPVASVAIYTRREPKDIRTIAMDTSSRTSVALVRVLCSKLYRITPVFEPLGPDLDAMLAQHDAALLIGDNALFQSAVVSHQSSVEVIDLGQAWSDFTRRPFVYAFWAGKPGVLTAAHVKELQETRDRGVAEVETVAKEYLKDAPERQALGARYLRDNIKYHFGDDERKGLELFYRYASEIGVAPAGAMRFYGR